MIQDGPTLLFYQFEIEKALYYFGPMTQDGIDRALRMRHIELEKDELAQILHKLLELRRIKSASGFETLAYKM